jgi:hypothetical protein
MPTLYLDIETRSAANLRDCGAYIYAIDASTQVLCLFYAIDDAEPQLWLPSDPVPAAFLDIARRPTEWQLVAHNYDFERAILDNILVPRHGFRPIPLEAQHCTQRLALANAYPAELDLLAQALGLPYRKDPAAREAMLAVVTAEGATQAQGNHDPNLGRGSGQARVGARALQARCDHHPCGVAIAQA